MMTSRDGSESQKNIYKESVSTRRPKSQDNAATGGSAAAVRAIAIQFIRFYFRAPIKAFFRTRVDYMAYARAINPHITANEAWSMRLSTAGLLAHAVKAQGWGFIPKHVLPPMLANMTVGAILYTSYLQTLGALYAPASHSSKRIFPPPPANATFLAGAVAGAIQSTVAAPLDALQVRFDANSMIEGQHTSILDYAKQKLREIGLRGIFAGWTLSLTKDSLGYGLFFATFETIKSQGYYEFVTRYYGNLNPYAKDCDKTGSFLNEGYVRPTLRPHYAIEPCFLLLAGVGASITQQIVQYPLSAVQHTYYGRIDSFDKTANTIPGTPGRPPAMQSFYRAYYTTLVECRMQAQKLGGWRRWLYKGFLLNTIRQVPSTSAGLVVFEMVRRKYAWQDESVVIEKDGYDVLLS